MSDEFNFDGKPARTTRTAGRSTNKGSGGGAMQMWDMLSILVLIVTVCVGLYFVLVFINPGSSLNILPPGGRATPTLTPTATLIQLEPTWTASPTLFVTPTDTPRPTFTPLPTDTPFSLVPPTRTPKPTSTPKAPFTASVSNVESSLVHPDLACAQWAGIGGTVIDNNGSHIIGFAVVLRGSLDGKIVEQLTVSGINKEYGQSGFEFKIGDAPIASKGTLYVQVLDQAGIPLSDKIYVNTSAECNKNLVLVRFKKTR
jgi:hypothetical protein